MLRQHRLLIAWILTFPIAGIAASPYVEQTSRSIKSLSEAEVAGYVAGSGMGFAKAAELNGFPGPAHVLDLADELALSLAQRDQSKAIFASMQARAQRAGRRLIDEERRLDELFRSKAISPSVLHESLDSIAALQREIREAHLQAHLEQTEILTAAQVAKYAHLRGYSETPAGPHHAH